MLRIKTKSFHIKNQSDFSLEEMMSYTEDMEAGKFPESLDKFDYVMYDEQTYEDILESTYKVNSGYINIQQQIYTLLKATAPDTEELKRLKRQYLIALQEVGKSYRDKKVAMNKKKNNPDNTKFQYQRQNNANKTKQKEILEKLKGKRGLMFLGLIVFVMLLVYILVVTDPNKKGASDVATKEEIYQQALLGEEEKAIDNFAKLDQETLTKKDKQIYAQLLAQKEEYDKAVKLSDAKFVESYLISRDYYSALEEFNKKYPTNNGKFDLAIHQNKFSDAINYSQGIDKTNNRKKQLVKAYIETDNLNKAKELAATTEDKEVTKMIADEQNKRLKGLEEAVKSKEDDLKKAKDKKEKKSDIENKEKALKEANENLEKFKKELK
ncbi:TPA: hypothetical protein PE758_002683 [Staphylococcus aureus]|nr:hypothetical protein [Staphylococcus aureus]QOA18007.1 hypothetical protein FPO49_15035 [Staphylococcus aureus]HDF8012965.1 hypothetical protein [Staphylococcus aureus]HDF8477772.1 hypothetical protein [Staphylococcus aureus]HDF8746808.1 hypothetical protein [Staphylococcus aureus]